MMRTNYSFLWQYLEPRQLLPKLVDKELMTETRKKEAESYTQKFAQNSVIINQLFHSDCPPLKLCDTLDVTGQEHIARKLLQGTHCVGYIYQNCYVRYLHGNQNPKMTTKRKEQNTIVSLPDTHALPLVSATCIYLLLISHFSLSVT